MTSQMSNQIVVEKYNDSGAVPEALSARMTAITDEIRQRAFGLFELRGGRDGSDVEDWLRAESEVVWSPASELIEGKYDFNVRVALPGFDAADVEVTATPESLIIEAEAAHTHEGKEGSVCFCDFSGKNLFRRVDLPAPINLEKVTSSLEKGILRVNAPKAKERKQVSATA